MENSYSNDCFQSQTSFAYFRTSYILKHIEHVIFLLFELGRVFVRLFPEIRSLLISIQIFE